MQLLLAMAPSDVARGHLIWIKAGNIKPNRWNPNVMGAEMLEHEMASIREFGFVDPITVRHIGESHGEDQYEIIDGEHRWKCGMREDRWLDEDGKLQIRPPMEEFPCWSLGKVDDAAAQQLTIVLNETRGTADEPKLATLIAQIAEKRSQFQLQAVLPFSAERIAEMSGRRGQIDFAELQKKRKQAAGGGERWVERIYRLPIDAAKVLDEAIAKVRDEGVDQDWRALEMIAAEFLAS